MIGTRSTRWALGSSIPLVLLLVASFVVNGKSPGENAPTHTIMSFYAAHRSSQMLASYLILLAVMVFLVFIAGLRTALRSGETEEGLAAAVGLAAGIVFVPLTVVGYGADIVLAAEAASGSPSVFQAVRDLSGAAIGISDLPQAVSLAAFSVGMIASPAFPRWLGCLGLLPAAGLLFGSFEPLVPQLGGIGFLGFLLFLIWTLATGIVALRRGEPGSRRAEARTPTTAVPG